MHTKLPIISFLQKLVIFCCLIFEEFEKEFLNQGFYGQLPEQTWSEYSFGFQNNLPHRAPRPFIQMVPRWKWVFVRITNNDHQFFRESYYQKLENIFLSFSYTDFMIMTFIPLFWNISKLHNDKRRPKQVYSFHANADIKAMFTFLKKHSHEWKHS